MRALEAKENILKLKDSLGISDDDLYAITLFIETSLKTPHEYTYLRKEDTHLARTLEVCPEGPYVFIHLKTHGIKKIGSGSAKHVTYSIKYDVERPELVANCIIKDKPRASRQRSIANEIAACTTLKNLPGVCHTYAITRHAKPDGSKPVVSILQKFYAGSTLKSYFCRRKTLTRASLVALTQSFLAGLRNIHSRGFFHGDLHLPNLLIEQAQSPTSGILIDFGRCMTCSQAQTVLPKIQAVRHNNPPEVFFAKPEAIDARACDIYAMGLCLYRIYFQQEPEWTQDKMRFRSIESVSEDERAQFAKELSDEIHSSIETVSKETDPDDPFPGLIFSMIDPDPAKRADADALCRQFEQSFEKPR